MKINIHAGHNPDGKIACGAVGLLYESTEARKVVQKLITLLTNSGHTVYDCTVNDGTSQSDVLKKIVSKCNAHTVDLDISVHFNAGAGDKSGNGKTTGVEVLVLNSASQAKQYAEKVCASISDLGFKNRGVKTSTGLYFLNSVKAPAMLIECCFVDDKDDYNLYNADRMAVAIAKGLGVEDVEARDIKIKINGVSKTVSSINVDGSEYVKLRGLDSDNITIGYDGVPTITTK